MSEIVLFDFDGEAVRTVTIDGETWFVGRDVCRCLDIANPWNALGRLPKEERCEINLNTLRTTEGIQVAPSDTVGTTDGISRRGNPNVIAINEPGLYRLIFESRKPEAERFKTWVFGTVLPTIRRTGRFQSELASSSSPPNAIPVLDLVPDELHARLALVREARRILGIRPARALWKRVGLPGAEDEAKTEDEARQTLQDYAQAFLDEECIRDPEAEVSVAMASAVYSRWALRRSAPLFARGVLDVQFAQLGIRKRAPAYTHFVGLRLRSPAHATPVADGSEVTTNA